MNNPKSAESFAGLEDVYEAVAAAIDRAGPEKRDVFLAKLVLKLANDIADTERVLAAVDQCLQDL